MRSKKMIKKISAFFGLLTVGGMIGGAIHYQVASAKQNHGLVVNQITQTRIIHHEEEVQTDPSAELTQTQTIGPTPIYQQSWFAPVVGTGVGLIVLSIVLGLGVAIPIAKKKERLLQAEREEQEALMAELEEKSAAAEAVEEEKVEELKKEEPKGEVLNGQVLPNMPTPFGQMAPQNVMFNQQGHFGQQPVNMMHQQHPGMMPRPMLPNPNQMPPRPGMPMQPGMMPLR